MTLVRLVVVVLAIVLSPAGGSAQKPTASDPFDRLAFMVGRWEGTAEGQPGRGAARREYARVLKSRFIRAVHWGEYPPLTACACGW